MSVTVVEPLTACPLCGEPHDASALLLAIDAYVVKVLEHAGNRIVRQDRGGQGRPGRWAQLSVPLCRAYMQWPMARDDDIAPILRGAWSALGELSVPWECFGTTPEQVGRVLDKYVTELLLTGMPHSLDEVAYQLHLH